jgi:hypothetical protein
MFTFEIAPEMDKEVDFAVRALSTTDKSSDVEGRSFKFAVLPKANTEMVEKASWISSPGTWRKTAPDSWPWSRRF